MSNKYERLDDKTDGLLLLEFRGQLWDEWVKFCHEAGYESTLRD